MKQSTRQLPVPTESVEQQQLISWAAWKSGAFPELSLLYHVPNEGKRSTTTGAKLRAEGLKAGVPDLCLPVARGGFHGLYIELKRAKGSKATPQQTQWLEALAKQGYCAALCMGWEAAAQVIENYLRQAPCAQSVDVREQHGSADTRGDGIGSQRAIVKQQDRVGGAL